MIYYSSKEPYDFRMFKTVRSFDDDICNSKITINKADQEESDLVEYILNVNNKTRPKNKDDKKKKNFLIAHKIFIMVENQLLMLLRADYFH